MEGRGVGDGEGGVNCRETINTTAGGEEQASNATGQGKSGVSKDLDRK